MPKKIPPPLPSGNPESTPIGFLYVPSDLFNDFSLSLEEERILAIVRSYNGSCYWTEERFAEFCRCSTRTIIRVIKNLEERGRLRKESRGNQSNLYSEIPSDAQSSIVTNCHDDKMSHPYCQNVTSIVTNCHDDSDKLSPYIDIYNTKNKDNDNTELVADAPTPTDEFSLILEEPQDSEVPLESESVKEPIEVSEAPPLPAAPPKAKKAVRPFEITDHERLKLLQYLREQAEVRGLIPKLEEDRLNLIVKETSNFWANKKKADWHRTVKNRIDQLFSWNRFSDWQAEAVGPSGLTITELNARLDYIFAWLHDTPVKPAVPFKDQADEDLATLVLISMFEENYEEVIKKKNIDDKKYYYKQFRELYEQAVKNERDRNKNANK